MKTNTKQVLSINKAEILKSIPQTKKEELEFFFQNDVLLNRLNGNGDSALNIYIQYAFQIDSDIVKFFIYAGYDLTKKNKDGKSSFSFVIDRVDLKLEIVQLFIETTITESKILNKEVSVHDLWLLEYLQIDSYPVCCHKIDGSIILAFFRAEIQI